MEDYRLDQSGQEVQDILNGAAMQVDLTAETERATEAEQTLQGNIDAEATRAQGAEGTLQDNIDAEEARAKAEEKQNADDIDAIEEKIPSGASSSNKLATEEYVADAVATATATFRGTYNLVSDLHLTVNATEQQIAAALAGAISTADNNDYCFILVPTSSETPTEIKEIDRYKFNGTAWAFEYKLNNSGFTAAQWAAINSGITSGDVTKLAALPTNAQLTTLLAGLQSDIDGEETRAKGVEGTLQDNIDAEETRAKAAEKQIADDIDAIEAVLPENASSENKVATESEINSLSAAIEAILLLIPSAATSLNKLADKAFVNSSIATATATFRGTYNLVNDLGLTTSATHAQIATALAGAILTADNNDYAFVQIPTSDAMPTEIAKTERYKFNGTAWEYEYDLNNSGFTADQWAAINSGITQALVTKLAALPTNAELTTELGTLTSGITTINQKIPAAASQANKLVDTAAMEAYIVEVLNVLTISYNVTSTDGHVTLAIQQTDGKITSVTLTTSDIASAADLNLKASQADLTALASRITTAEDNITTLGGRMTTAEGNITSLGGRMTTAESNITTINSNITSLGGRVSTNETDIANLQQLYNDLQQSKPVPVTALPETGQQQGVIYRLAGTTSYSDYMWNGSTWVLMATYDNAIDPRPKKASQNLVTSGGVFDNMGALDVSELNATKNPHTLAQYVDLSAALAAIPTDYQKGGMSIKFVQSSDNKYVQYRCMAQNFTTDVTQWQGVDNEPTAGSANLVKSGGVFRTVENLNDAIFDIEVDIISGQTWTIYPYFNLQGKQIYVKNIGTSGNLQGIRLYDANKQHTQALSVNIAVGASQKVTLNNDCYYIGFAGSTQKVKVIDESNLVNRVSVTEADVQTLNEDVAEIKDSMDDSLFIHELFDKNNSLDIIVDQRWQTSAHYLVTVSGFSVAVIYNISSFKEILVHEETPSGFGYAFFTIDSTLLEDGNISETDTKLAVPENAERLFVTYMTTDVNNVSITVSEGDWANYILSLRTENTPIVFKQKNQVLTSQVSGENLDYVAWFRGVCFGGFEYHFGSSVTSHSPADSYGVPFAFKIDANDNREVVTPFDSYLDEIDGRWAGGNAIGKSNDGNYMFVDAMCSSYPIPSPSYDGYVLAEYLFVFDKNLQIVKKIDIKAQGLRQTFGNILETPSGHLILTSYGKYNDDLESVALYRSNENIHDTFNLTFSLVHSFPTTTNGMNESTIGYAGNKLVMLARTNSDNSKFFETSDLEGINGWSEMYDTGIILHSPMLLSFNKWHIIPFAGSLVKTQSSRVPSIGYYDITNHRVVEINDISQGEVKGWGGYPSFIQIEDGIFACVYYDDYSNSATTVFYQRVNARYLFNYDYIQYLNN